MKLTTDRILESVRKRRDRVTGGGSFAARLDEGLNVAYVPVLDDVADHLMTRVGDGDVVLVMGAGTIERIGPQVIEALGESGATNA